MERMTSLLNAVRTYCGVEKGALAKMGMFLRVPPSGDAGTCCLSLCEKRPCDGQIQY